VTSKKSKLTPRRPSLWTGLVWLKPLQPGALEGRAGAYTNIVTWAADADEFRKNSETIAAKMDLYVMEVENVRLVSSLEAEGTLTEELEDMVQRAEGNPKAIIYGTFHTYPHEDA
jgi:hypothetical protein